MAYISFQPKDFFDIKLWTGTGASHAITGVGFQPDFAWIKSLSEGADHMWIDSVRGVTKYIGSNHTIADTTDAQNLLSFDSDGYTLGTANYTNWDPSTGPARDKTFVGWSWKAGTTSGLTGGTITPSAYSINTTSGFSMIAYTGTTSGGETIPHGLGVAPDMVIAKKLSGTGDFKVYHSGVDATAPEDYQSVLNTDAARDDSVGPWYDTAPTSTLVTLGTDNNTGSATYIAYCFASIKGYSKMGRYMGNGNADGTFVYTGFKPAFVVMKRFSGAEGWWMADKARPGYNVTDKRFEANESAAEDTQVMVDLLSNGFKQRATHNGTNGNGDEFMYMAFAESPLVSSNSKAGTAN